MVMTNVSYFCFLLALSFTYFISSALAFWTTDYYINAIKVERSLAFTWYSIIAFIPPITGAIIGAIIISKLGGYNDPRSSKILLLISLLVAISGLPLPLSDNFVVLCCSMGFKFLFAGFAIPTMTGKMISAVPAPFRTIANSNANFI